MTASRRGLTIGLGALALGLLVFSVTALQFGLAVDLALAQSSVRPPADATNVEPVPDPAVGGGTAAGSSVRPPPDTPVSIPSQPGIPRQVELLPPQEGPIAGQLQVLGPNSDADLWAAIREGAQGTVSIPNDKLGVMIQPVDVTWGNWRQTGGPLQEYGGWVIGGMLVLLALFFLIRGRIRIDQGKSGVKIKRFGFIERFFHWMLAVSFILLALTGLNLLYGKSLMIQLFAPDEEAGPIVVEGEDQTGWMLLGPDGYSDAMDVFATVALWGKWLHNNIAWAFMLALVVIFVMWLWHNLPTWTDVKWLAQGGGFIGKSHPHARKFNAGQKLVFWATVLLGASVSLSGLALLFPYELPMFGKTFEILNDLGIAAVWGSPLPTDLTLMQEQQYAQIWHSIISLTMIAIILAHIYIGTLGMEGAFDAMGTGWVDRNWAEEHHDLWVEKKDREAEGGPAGRPVAQPAE